MELMVTMTFDAGRRAEIGAQVAAEQARVRELMEQGTVRAVYVAAQQGCAWLVLHTVTEEEARQVVESLPLHPYATVELVPLISPQ